MALSVVQFQSVNGVGSTGSYTLSTSAVGAGNLLVILQRSGASVAISSFSQETWTSGSVFGATGQKSQLWYVASAVGGWTSNLITFGGAAGFPCTGFWEISGAAASPLDFSTGYGEQQVNNPPVNSGTYSTSAANDILFVMGANNGTWSVAPTPTFTGGPTWTVDVQTANGDAAFGHSIVSTIQSAQTTTYNWSGGTASPVPGVIACYVVAFKSAVQPASSGSGWTNRQRKFINLR